MATEQERELYFKARNRAMERLVHEPPLIQQAENGFSIGLRWAIAGPHANSGKELEWIQEKIKTEDNFAFGFVCGILARLEAVKGKAYQASWQKQGEVDGAMVNMERKWDRLESTTRHGATGETKSQVLGDLTVYGIKWLTLRSEIDPEEFLKWVKEVRSL